MMASSAPVSVTIGRRKLTATPVKSGETRFVTFRVVSQPNNYTKITRTRKLEVELGKAYEVDLRKRDEKTDPEPRLLADRGSRRRRTGSRLREGLVHSKSCLGE